MNQRKKAQHLSDRPAEHLSDGPTAPPPAPAPAPDAGTGGDQIQIPGAGNPAPPARSSGPDSATVLRAEMRAGFQSLRDALLSRDTQTQAPTPAPAAAPRQTQTPPQLPPEIAGSAPTHVYPARPATSEDAPQPASGGELTTRVQLGADELDQLLAGFEARLGARMEALEAGRAIPGAGVRQVMQSAPLLNELRQVIEQSPQWQSWRDLGIPNLKVSDGLERHGIQIPSLLRMNFGAQALADAIGAGDIGDWATPFRRPGVIQEPPLITGLLDDIPYQGLDGSPKYEFLQEKANSRYAYLSTTLAADIVADAGATATFAEVEGFMIGTTQKIFTSAGMQITPKIQSINETTKVVTYESNLTFDASTGDRVNSTYFGAIGESGSKPHGYLAIELVTLTLQTFPIAMAVTQQQIDAISILLSFLQGRMRLGARYNATWHMLYGSGSTGQCHGFFNETGVQTHNWSDGETGDKMLDAIIRGAAKVRPLAGRQVTLNPNDWNAIGLEKDGEGRYVHTSANQGPVRIIDGPNGQWIGNMRVRLEDVMQEGDYLVANHMFASAHVDQERSRFAIGWVNDQFIKNERTALYEDSYEHAIFSLSAYCTGQFDNAPA